MMDHFSFFFSFSYVRRKRRRGGGVVTGSSSSPTPIGACWKWFVQPSLNLSLGALDASVPIHQPGNYTLGRTSGSQRSAIISQAKSCPCAIMLTFTTGIREKKETCLHYYQDPQVLLDLSAVVYLGQLGRASDEGGKFKKRKAFFLFQNNFIFS